MSLNERVVADVVRHRLGLSDGKRMPAIISAIPEALKETGRKVAADPSTRALLITDPTVAKIALDADGKLDLSTSGLYTTYNAIKEFMDLGYMWLLATVTCLSSAIDVTNDTISVAIPGRLAVGDKLQVTTTGSLPGGISGATNYYVKTVSGTLETKHDPSFCLVTLAPTAALASTVDLTSQGTGTHTFTVQATRDSPLQKLGGAFGGQPLEQFERQLDSLFRYYYILGNTLQVLPAGLAGSVAFAVPRYPTTVANLGPSPEMETIFFDTLVKIIQMSPAVP